MSQDLTNLRQDVVVIGGGIVGAACAWFLARAGKAVTLIDQGGIATGTSGCCMGHLMVMPGPPLMYEMSWRSVMLWRQFHAEHGEFDLLDCGALWLAEDESELELLEGLRVGMEGHEERAEMLTPAQLLRREPGLASDLAGGFWYPYDAVVLPMAATGALLRAAVQRGARVLPFTAATGVERDGANAVRGVKTAGGVLPAEAVVLAAGVWSPALAAALGLADLPIFPRRGDLAITMPHRLPVKHQLLEVSYLRTAAGKSVEPDEGVVDPGAVAVNVQPQTNGTFLIGSTRQFSECREVNLQLLQKSLARCARYVPAVEHLQVVRTWAGLRPYTKDKRPFIGPVDEVPGLFLACGHEGLGISLSMVTGEMVAQAVVGQPSSVDPRPFLHRRVGQEVAGG